MRSIFTLFISIAITAVYSQNVNIYFEKIRNNEAALTAFFSQMPKGGDLHHHYSGSLYAEPMLERAIAENFYLDTETMKVAKEKPATGKWEQFSTLKNRGELELYKQKIMQKWSVKDYNHVDYPSDKLFFESFSKFGALADGNFEKGLLEIKNRAIKENVSYIETQFTRVWCDINTSNLEKMNSVLKQFAAAKNEHAVFKVLDSISGYFLQQGATSCAKEFGTNFLQKLHNSLGIDDDRFTMRYQAYVIRFMQPVDLFKNLLLSFIAAANNPLIVGVNIVSPEDGETSMKDYWLHMIMYKYCNTRFPAVKYSVHAGELTLGMVQPEDLTWHIRSAVYTAKASRIGHGVDIAYEDSSYSLLRYMSKNKIAVEINLASNEFILKVIENRHPVTLYKQFGVPIVISTDDAGILRTNMTEQYVLLAKRYKEFSYADIKQIVYNSIQYSFIKDVNVKTKLLSYLDNRFKKFEYDIRMMQ